MNVVISQPMFLPWIGLFDQMRLADVFIHYDDVQMPRGRSFMSRVQIPTTLGTNWLSAQVDRGRSGETINTTYFKSDTGWRDTHLRTFRHTYAKARNFPEMIGLAEEIYAFEGDCLADFNINAIEKIASAIGLRPRVLKSSETGVPGQSTERLVALCEYVQGTEYITGHGAANYMDHEAFERHGINVSYMDYATNNWPQITPSFTPYVTIFDALSSVPANEIVDLMSAGTTPWRQFLAKRKQSDGD